MYGKKDDLPRPSDRSIRLHVLIFDQLVDRGYRQVGPPGFLVAQGQYFWSLGHPFIIRELVFISAGKGAGEKFLSTVQNSGPSDEGEDIVSQP